MRTLIATKFLDILTIVSGEQTVYFHNWKGFWTPALVKAGKDFFPIVEMTNQQLDVLGKRVHTMRIHQDHLPARRLEELEPFKPILSARSAQ